VAPAGRSPPVGHAYAVSCAVRQAVSRRGDCGPSPRRPRWSLAYFETGGGATGTIRPSTSPRMPTSGF